METKRSRVWEHFKKHAENLAKCNICKLELKVKAGNTSNLKRHLETKHVGEYKKIKQQTAKPTTSQESTVSVSQQEFHQETLYETIERKAPPNKLLPSSKKAKSLNRSLAKMVCVDYQPFSIVQDSGFREFVNCLDPRYEIPTRHKLANEIIPKLYMDKKAVIKREIKCVTSLCFTSDCWTSRSAASYLSLTGHFIDQAWDLKNVCLAVRNFPDHHTAVNISECIITILKEYDIDILSSDISMYFVTDNARNFTKAVNSLPVESRTCFAHTLQLVVEDGLKQFKGLQNILSKARSIVGHFKHSVVSTEQLKQTQKQMGLPEHKLKQDVATRWNSSYYMLERLLEQKNAVSYILADEGNLANLQPYEWKTVRELVQVLKPFELVTEMLSGNTYSTASMIIPVLIQLKSGLNELKEINNLQDYLLGQIDKRWPGFTEDSILSIATFLDPRFKMVCFSEHEKEQIIDAVTELILGTTDHERDDVVDNANQQNNLETAPTGDINLENKKVAKAKFWASFQKKVNSEYGSTTKSVVSPFTVWCEINNYISVSPIELTKPNCPLKWWRNNAIHFPHLSPLAR